MMKMRANFLFRIEGLAESDKTAATITFTNKKVSTTKTSGRGEKGEISI